MTGVITHGVADGLRAALRSQLRTPGGEALEVPEDARATLIELVDVLEMSPNAVVFPADVLLSTQQAAEVLGVSRMTVTRIIDRGELESTGAGTHRRVAATELSRYGARRKQQRRAALHNLAQEVGEETSPDRIVSTR